MDASPADDPRSSVAQKQLLELLGSQDWEAILKDLLDFTMTRILNRSWLTVWGGVPPGAPEAKDLVMESVADIISGVRRAPNGVALVAFLKQVIRSKISHLVRSKENRCTRRLDPCPEDREIDKDLAAMRPSDQLTETDLVSKELEEINAQLLDLLIGELSDEPDLQKIIECNIDGIFKREEVANRLGKTVSEITNMKKRFERRLSAFRAKYADRNPFLEERK
jgi:DNA-directed RNA polymerase specialized sigma24 family protein